MVGRVFHQNINKWEVGGSQPFLNPLRGLWVSHETVFVVINIVFLNNCQFLKTTTQSWTEKWQKTDIKIKI